MLGFTKDPASYRDPSGFVFTKDGEWYRQVNKIYQEDYSLFVSSGLSAELQEAGLLVPHQEIRENLTGHPDYFITLKPEPVPVISYPYEWCYDQLKDAALLTLRIMRAAMTRGMILKDATPFNIQFYRGRPVLIDTLSFTRYNPSQPWIAYRQFCETFLFPLLLGKYTRLNMQQLMRVYLEGIPARVTARLLPLRSRWNASVWMHVFLQSRLSDNQPGTNTRTNSFSATKMKNLLAHLEQMTGNCYQRRQTNWTNYYTETILNKNYLAEKDSLVGRFLQEVNGKCILDLGANDGYFSLLAGRAGFEVVATDADDACINNLYQHLKKEKIPSVLPLYLDITNPTPALGFSNTERPAFFTRVQPDLVLALALVHHLAIGNNIPFEKQAAFFASLAPRLLVEFVPAEDPKTIELLSHKELRPYTQEEFEAGFAGCFQVLKKEKVGGSSRIIYLMERR